MRDCGRTDAKNFPQTSRIPADFFESTNCSNFTNQEGKRLACPRRERKNRTGISGILRDLIQSRGLLAARPRKISRLTTEVGNAFVPMFPHEMRNKNNPMRRRRLGQRPQKNTRLKSATAPRERRVGKTSNASGGCAFQARRRCGICPKRALRVAHGVTIVAPRRGEEVSVRWFRRASGTLILRSPVSSFLCVKELKA